MNRFSFPRLIALLRKETIQVMRDSMTLRMIIAIPIMQLFLFGYAINSDPKHLPAGLLSIDDSKYERTIAAALNNSGYYNLQQLRSEQEADEGLARGDLMFVVEIPPGFDRAVDRGENPSVLVDADATDPTAIGNAVAALNSVLADLNRDLPPIRQAAPQTPAVNFVVHARYNPEQLTVLNIVPGLIVIVLTFSTLFVTTLAITRERERGTMENLLAMPVRPIEVMIAKIIPYVFIGYVQVGLILVASVVFFGLPVRGSLPLLLGALGLFIASQPRPRRDLLDHRRQPDAGGPARPVHPHAVVHAVGVHVPVPRHAGLGAGRRRRLSHHPRDAHRSRHAAEGQRLERDRAGDVADGAVHRRRHRLRRLALPRDARLSAICATSHGRDELHTSVRRSRPRARRHPTRRIK